MVRGERHQGKYVPLLAATSAGAHGGITETVGIPAVKQPEVYSESTELVPIEAAGPQPSVPTGWAVCTATEPKSTVTIGRTLPIEIGNCRVMANADTDPDLLLRVCKTLAEA